MWEVWVGGLYRPEPDFCGMTIGPITDDTLKHASFRSSDSNIHRSAAASDHYTVTGVTLCGRRTVTGKNLDLKEVNATY